jgi:hypothetical protein
MGEEARGEWVMAERKPYAGDTLELLVQQVRLALVLGKLPLRLLEVRLAHLQLRAERTARQPRRRSPGRNTGACHAADRCGPLEARTRASARVQKPVHAHGYESRRCALEPAGAVRR